MMPRSLLDTMPNLLPASSWSIYHQAAVSSFKTLVSRWMITTCQIPEDYSLQFFKQINFLCHRMAPLCSRMQSLLKQTRVLCLQPSPQGISRWTLIFKKHAHTRGKFDGKLIIKDGPLITIKNISLSHTHTHTHIRPTSNTQEKIIQFYIYLYTDSSLIVQRSFVQHFHSVFLCDNRWW